MAPEPAQGDLEEVPALPKPPLLSSKAAYYFFAGLMGLPLDASGKVTPEGRPALQTGPGQLGTLTFSDC